MKITYKLVAAEDVKVIPSIAKKRLNEKNEWIDVPSTEAFFAEDPTNKEYLLKLSHYSPELKIGVITQYDDSEDTPKKD